MQLPKNSNQRTNTDTGKPKHLSRSWTRLSTILHCLTSKFGSPKQRHWNHQHRHHHQVQGQVDANPAKSLNWRPPTDLCLDSFCSAFGKNRKDTARTVWITSGAFKHYRESWIHIDIRKLFRKELKAQGGCRHLSVSVLLVRADKIRDDQRRKVRFFIEWVKWWTHVNITTCDIWFFISL